MKREKPGQVLTRKVVAVVFLIAGIALMVSYINDFRHSPGSNAWPSVEGVVTNLSVHRGKRYSGNSPSVRYEYEVEGVSYRGYRISFKAHESGDHDRIVARYPEGSKVRVYYQPSDPGSSVLEPGSGRRHAAFGVLFSLFLVGAAFVFWFRRID